MVQRFRNLIFSCLFILLIHSNVFASNIIYSYSQNQISPINQVYENKETLFKAFFKDFYDYILSYPHGKEYLELNNIYTLAHFYDLAKRYNEYEPQGMPWIGDVTGFYFAKKDKLENIYLQTAKDGFIGYCLQNNKYIPQIQFFILWFYNLRKDEGLFEKYGMKALDFLDYPHDTIIDICKLFYWNKDNVPYYLKSKGYVETYIENIPGVINY